MTFDLKMEFERVCKYPADSSSIFYTQVLGRMTMPGAISVQYQRLTFWSTTSG